jgi:murein DD-endopeptidase MepM/ murein hydrolase activator NlpD
MFEDGGRGPEKTAAHAILAALAAIAIAFGLFLVVVLLGPLVLFQNLFAPSPVSAAGPAPAITSGPIPGDLVPVFNETARALDVNPYLLASVAQQESGMHAESINGSGCAGFMQLGVRGACGDTWDATVTLTGQTQAALIVRDAYKYGQRPNGYTPAATRHPDYNDAFDAVMAAAVWLRHKVGGNPIPNLDGTAYRAACGYYGSCSDSIVNYAQDVITRARQWAGESALSSVTVNAQGYVNPFRDIPKLTPERIDMGVDYNAPAGSPILAIGNATVLAATDHGSGWTSPLNTQAAVYYRLDDGPYAGKTIYVAEDIQPTVAAKQSVRAGAQIATFLSSSTGLETGWGSGTPYGCLAFALGQQAPGDPGGWSSAAGMSFNRLLVGLGAPAGIYNPGAPRQTMPAGYP